MRSHKGKGRILATDRLMSAGTLKRTSESMRNFPTACQLVLSPPSGLFPRSLAFSLSLAVPPLPRHQFQSPCLTSRSANNTPPRVSPPSPRPTVPPPRPHVASVTQDLCMSPAVSLSLVAHIAASGLFSFASTTLILSLYNCSVRDISDPEVVVGMALGVGGLAQLLAGMWEFASGNTFGATGELHLPARSQLHFPRIQTRATICRSGRSSPSQRGSAGVTPLLDAASSLIYFALSPVNFYPSAGPFIRVLQYLADALSLSPCSLYILRWILAVVRHALHPWLWHPRRL